MPYPHNGGTVETDEEGYVLEPVFDDSICPLIAQVEGIELTDAHWQVIGYLRDQYREHGHTPNNRNMLKDLAELMPGIDNKALYDLFPGGPAKQAVRVAGLPKPFGKGGY